MTSVFGTRSNAFLKSKRMATICVKMTARHLRYMERTRRSILAAGMLAHTWAMAWQSGAAVAGLGCNWFNPRLLSTHRCSIGFRSGLRAGQGIVLMLLACRNCWVALAVWAVALSCGNRKFWWLDQNGMTWGLKTWSMQRCALTKFPRPWPRFAKKIGPTRWCSPIPPHIMTFGPPHGSLSNTQASVNRSPTRRQTLTRPPDTWTQNRLSSVKRTLPHWYNICSSMSVVSKNGKFTVKVAQNRLRIFRGFFGTPYINLDLHSRSHSS